MEIVSARRNPVRSSPASPLPPDWAASLRAAVRDPRELCQLLDLPSEFAERAATAASDFPLFVTREYLSRIEPGRPEDPLLRQVLPVFEEAQTIAGFTADPVEEREKLSAPGLLTKYRGRALLIVASACAIHCRYCFRRWFPYEGTPKSLAAWKPAIEAIAADSSIEEVLLSGGDPLMAVDATLAELNSALAEIPHVRRLRVHTRLPVVIPQRVTSELLAWLTGTRLTPWMVVHVNHAREIDGAVAEALARLIDAGIPVLNQSVLLRGVNDDLESLVELSRRLIDLRVQPYYLHALDRVAGAAHFEVPLARGVELVREMRALLPGYAVPRFVRETPGLPSKELIE